MHEGPSSCMMSVLPICWEKVLCPGLYNITALPNWSVPHRKEPSLSIISRFLWNSSYTKGFKIEKKCTSNQWFATSLRKSGWVISMHLHSRQWSVFSLLTFRFFNLYIGGFEFAGIVSFRNPTAGSWFRKFNGWWIIRVLIYLSSETKPDSSCITLS
jgi:hypothetical protein